MNDKPGELYTGCSFVRDILTKNQQSINSYLPHCFTDGMKDCLSGGLTNLILEKLRYLKRYKTETGSRLNVVQIQKKRKVLKRFASDKIFVKS